VFGQVSAFSPDYVKARIAAARLFKLFDRVPLIDSSCNEGNTPVSMNDKLQSSSKSSTECALLRGVSMYT